ncbi:MAG: ferritin-like domain-containing protein [Nitrospinaceae bacterium]
MMSASAEALKKAIEYEKLALEKYKEAINCSTHEETRETLKKIASEKNQQIDSLSWMVLAEAGQLETQTGSEQKEGEAPQSSASKCPFSGALKDMGIDITKMGSMSKEDMAKMSGMSGEDMAKMMGLGSGNEKSGS